MFARTENSFPFDNSLELLQVTKKVLDADAAGMLVGGLSNDDYQEVEGHFLAIFDHIHNWRIEAHEDEVRQKAETASRRSSYQ